MLPIEPGGFYENNRTGAHADAANWFAGGIGFATPRLLLFQE